MCLCSDSGLEAGIGTVCFFPLQDDSGAALSSCSEQGHRKGEGKGGSRAEKGREEGGGRRRQKEGDDASSICCFCQGDEDIIADSPYVPTAGSQGHPFPAVRESGKGRQECRDGYEGEMGSPSLCFYAIPGFMAVVPCV